MKPYLIITAQAIALAAIGSLLPLALYVGCEIFLATILACVFGAIILWVFGNLIKIEIDFQKQMKEIEKDMTNTKTKKQIPDFEPMTDDEKRSVFANDNKLLFAYASDLEAERALADRLADRLLYHAEVDSEYASDDTLAALAAWKEARIEK